MTDAAPYLFVHRADYQRVLAAEAQRRGARIALGQRVVEVDTDTPAVIMEDGRIAADLVIGADGIHSTLRPCALGKSWASPNITGDAAYRIILPASRLRSHPALRALLDRPACDIWIGPGTHAVGYPIRNGEIYNIVLCFADRSTESLDRAPTTLATVRMAFQGWDPILQSLLGLVEDVEKVEKWRLMDVGPLPTWTTPSGQMLLMGDACHATLPYLAQGAALAVEDAEALGMLLARCTSTQQVPRVVRLFEQVRKARVEEVVERSRKLRDSVHHLPDGPAQQARDKTLLEDSPGKGSPSPWKDPAFVEWLFEHDVDKQVREVWTRYERHKL